jgi:hypothetical protein
MCKEYAATQLEAQRPPSLRVRNVFEPFAPRFTPPFPPPSLSQSMKMSCTSQARLGPTTRGGWGVPSRVCPSECLRSMRDVVFLRHCRHGALISRAEYRSTPSLESSTLREPPHYHGGFQGKTRMLRMALNLFVSPQHCICLRDIVDGQS